MAQIRISYNTDQEYMEILKALEKKLEIKGVKIQRNRTPYKRAYIDGEWRDSTPFTLDEVEKELGITKR